MTGKNILVIGGGGREHALCWKLKQSAEVGTLFCAPGNAGIARVAECVQVKDYVSFCRINGIALVVIGPEAPLVEGVTDGLRAANIPVFGPSQAASILEASKDFTKRLCEKYNIPTAAYCSFTEAEPAKAYIAEQSFPLVVKADGLAAGKGVIIAENRSEAEQAVDDMFAGAFGEAGAKVVIEEFLQGEEISFFAIANGKEALEFSHAQDHKRAGEGDTGPNTGGMGTYTPVRLATPALREEIMRRIITPTVQAMQAENMPFSGMLFAGLMVTEKGPMLLEYNTRFGDPETQSMLLAMQGDILPWLEWGAGVTAQAPAANHGQAAVCVVMAAKGYPGAYEKGSVIKGLERAEALDGVCVFHAGTAEKNGDITANGGRVLGVTATAATVAEAQALAYRAVDAIDWKEGFCRRDIGWRALREA